MKFSFRVPTKRLQHLLPIQAGTLSCKTAVAKAVLLSDFVVVTTSTLEKGQEVKFDEIDKHLQALIQGTWRSTKEGRVEMQCDEGTQTVFVGIGCSGKTKVEKQLFVRK